MARERTRVLALGAAVALAAAVAWWIAGRPPSDPGPRPATASSKAANSSTSKKTPRSSSSTSTSIPTSASASASTSALTSTSTSNSTSNSNSNSNTSRSSSTSTSSTSASCSPPLSSSPQTSSEQPISSSSLANTSGKEHSELPVDAAPQAKEPRGRDIEREEDGTTANAEQRTKVSASAGGRLIGNPSLPELKGTTGQAEQATQATQATQTANATIQVDSKDHGLKRRSGKGRFAGNKRSKPGASQPSTQEDENATCSTTNATSATTNAQARTASAHAQSNGQIVVSPSLPPRFERINRSSRALRKSRRNRQRTEQRRKQQIITKSDVQSPEVQDRATEGLKPKELKQRAPSAQREQVGAETSSSTRSRNPNAPSATNATRPKTDRKAPSSGNRVQSSNQNGQGSGEEEKRDLQSSTRCSKTADAVQSVATPDAPTMERASRGPETAVAGIQRSEASSCVECCQCGRSFGSTRACQQHTAAAHAPRPLVSCPICKKVFRSEAGLKRHSKDKHGENRATNVEAL